MLITICYSVLTWIQSRQRKEILTWVRECILKETSTTTSLLLIRERVLLTNNASSGDLCPSLSTDCLNGESGHGSYYSSTSASPCSTLRRDFSVNASATSSPSKSAMDVQSLASVKQTSDLCYNHRGVRRSRLLFEEEDLRVLSLAPQQIVELHDWTAFIGTVVEPRGLSNGTGKSVFYILLEAEPGVTQNKALYRRFSQYGQITAWKCGHELALVLHSGLDQLVELMHIFRLGQIILEGGWRVYRLTTITCEGTIGTLISNTSILPKKSLTPGDLRRLSAGIYEYSETPSIGLSQDTSKHDITKISEESLVDSNRAEAEDRVEISKLPNWYERSPKKRSIASVHYTERPLVGKRKGSLSNLSQKSASLASLIFCSRSMSVDEQDSPRRNTSSVLASPVQTPDREPTKAFKSISRASTTRQSCDSLLAVSISPALDTSSSPVTSRIGGGSQVHLSSAIPLSSTGVRAMSLSTSAVHGTPVRSGLGVRSPHRSGKPPNILVLCEDEKLREQIASVLKIMLAADRYIIYDIRWDQLAVGGWAEQTALLVISGKIPDPAHVTILLQFLGDGGRLFAWCCETPPFGLALPPSSGPGIRHILNYTTSQTHALRITGSGWGASSESSTTPSKYQRVLETNDSEGYSRPLTASVFARTKGSGETVIIQLDGGTLGGKAVLSQVLFEECMDEETSVALLSVLLSQNLGMDCTRIKTPEYSAGYLLGDHKKILEFLTGLPATVQQPELTLEFIPRGEKGSTPSHQRLPIHSLECPPKFSTLDFFENLKTRELGRLVICTDVVTSVMNVLTGHPLKHGLVVIGRQQTAGRGRGRNVWLSPEGCACYGIQLNLSLESGLGRRLTLVQHVAALSVILAVPSHKELNLRVKWPNDIYLNEQKIGGVLVESRLEGKLCVVNIGIGVNVANSYPTVNLNSELSAAAAKKGEKPNLLTCETFVAKAVTQLELLLDSAETGPLDSLLELYVQNWIHNTEDEVNIELSEGKFVTCKLSGVDEFGFLRVTEIVSGHVFSVQPDGNSFDIANRLIAIKEC